jgi:hypothetical protein
MNSTTQLAADGDRDSIVDVADFNPWRSNFGLSFPSVGGLGGGLAVPEPASILLSAMAALSWYFWLERRRR